MDDFVEQVGEAIRDLQAAQIATTRMLRAIISTHPNPEALRKAWRQYAATSVADAEMKKASDPGRKATNQALLDAVNHWSSLLERDLPDA